MHAILGTRGVARVVLRHTRSAHTLADGVASIDVDPGLEEILARGLERLPLDPRQRERARSLARDTSDHLARPAGSRARASGRTAAPALAAAVAYAIVFVDRVPLSQSEVASCFRVSVSSLRSRFVELRAHLDLLPGDSRYRTIRRR